MFDHVNFDKYVFEDIPLEQDLFVVDEIYLEEYENSMLRYFDGADYEAIGYVSYVAVRKINDNSIELSWCPNIFDRFHEITITLPKDQFIACVGCWKRDERPRIFVKSAWLENIHLRSYSIFALIDAINVKNALENGKITREKLIALRSAIDSLSKKHQDISFISFADNLLVKSNWTIGQFKSTVRYSYEPEIFIFLASEVNKIYESTLGLSTYTVVTQGSNEYYDDPLLHISETRNHICLNSLGIPFEQLMKIDSSARDAIRKKVHDRAELYMDEQFYHSLKFKFEFDQNAVSSNTYKTKMRGTPSKYYYSSINNILSNLKSSKVA